LDRGAFFILCRLVWVALEAADEDGDWRSARDLMVMAATFYTKSDGPGEGGSGSSSRTSPRSSQPHSATSSNTSTAGGISSQIGSSEDKPMYLQECLREAAIWRNEDYWSAIFFGMVLARCYKTTNLTTPPPLLILKIWYIRRRRNSPSITTLWKDPCQKRRRAGSLDKNKASRSPCWGVSVRSPLHCVSEMAEDLSDSVS